MRRCVVNRGVLILLCFFALKANGRTISANSFVTEQTTKLALQSTSTRSFNIDSSTLAFLFAGGHQQITDFPIGISETGTLDLKPAHSPLEATTKVWEGSSHGTIHIAAPAFAAFRGKILGEPHSRVMLTTFGGKLLVSIARESGELFVFGPAKNESEGNTHLFVHEAALFGPNGLNPLKCLNEDLPEINIPREHSTMNTQALTSLLQIDIAVEADTCFYRAEGHNLTMVLGYIASLFAMSSTIYEDEANITWHIPWVKVWTDSDPYNVKGDAYQLPSKVRDYWTNNYRSVPRDVAHVMTSIGYGGGGYGWFDLCDTTYSYSVSSPQTGHAYPTFAFTYDAYIVAHEVGHNFSLPHSHTCDWNPPLDTCYTKDDPRLALGDACYGLPVTPRPSAGSIMSYCANANYTLSGNDFNQFKLAMTFTPRVDSALRANAEKAACIQPPDSPTVILRSPRGSETYSGDTTIRLMWSLANVTKVSLEYSSDGGSQWKPISSNIPSAIAYYNWTLPNITSQKMLVRAFDPGNPSVADTSLLFFSVKQVAAVGEATLREERSPSLTLDRYWLTVNTPEIWSDLCYEIVDDRGSAIARGNAVVAGKTARIGVASIAAGTYFLRITSGSVPNTSVLPFTLIK